MDMISERTCFGRLRWTIFQIAKIIRNRVSINAVAGSRLYERLAIRAEIGNCLFARLIKKIKVVRGKRLAWKAKDDKLAVIKEDE